MKKLLFLTGAAIILASCTNNNKHTSAKVADTTKTSDMASMKMDSRANDKNMKVVKPSFTTVDEGVSAGINKLINDYMAVKNALVADDASGASDAAGVMFNDLKNMDKSKFPAEQKTAYEKNEDDLKENAEHINAKKDIDHQREHFGMMSDDMVDLIKSFGSTKPIYNDHCPMANDNKGSNWLSENRQISNPYMGKKDATCGNVMEVIKK